MRTRFRTHKALLGLLLSPVAVGVAGTAGQFASLDHPPGGTATGAPASTTGRRPQDRSRKRRDKGLTLPLGQGSSICGMSAPSDAALPRSDGQRREEKKGGCAGSAARREPSTQEPSAMRQPGRDTGLDATPQDTVGPLARPDAGRNQR
jgi:hypothetical protein